jgi:hypothetical protein
LTYQPYDQLHNPLAAESLPTNPNEMTPLRKSLRQRSTRRTVAASQRRITDNPPVTRPRLKHTRLTWTDDTTLIVNTCVTSTDLTRALGDGFMVVSATPNFADDTWGVILRRDAQKPKPIEDADKFIFDDEPATGRLLAHLPDIAARAAAAAAATVAPIPTAKPTLKAKVGGRVELGGKLGTLVSLTPANAHIRLDDGGELHVPPSRWHSVKVRNQIAGKCPPNLEGVSLLNRVKFASGRADNGAAHRGLVIAQQIIDAGLWDGVGEIWFHDIYTIHPAIELGTLSVHDLHITTAADGQPLVAMPQPTQHIA